MSELSIFNNINGGSTSPRTLPLQLLLKSKKNDAWIKTNMDFFYTEARKQTHKNSVFSDIRKMTQGEFTYRAVDIEKTLVGTSEEHYLKNLTTDTPLSTHLKHFDFLGICANAIVASFSELDDLYRVQANDEYSTNEYIRARTEKYAQHIQATLKAEIERYLIQNGIDPNKTDFKSDEERQQYLQQLDEEVKRLTPAEFEKDLAKNFKVIAVDWANNILKKDKEKFTLDKEDKQALIDFILTGRWFRHYKVGFDYYDIEYWKPEDVFFSGDLDAEHPQDREFIGRLTEMSLSDSLTRYGHLMTTKQQSLVGNFWGQEDDFKNGVNKGGVEPFGTHYIMPFENYFDHKINLQMEDVIGAPLAQTRNEDDTITRHWMPRSDFGSIGRTNHLRDQRTDIVVRNDMVEVMEVYWRSLKRIGIVIYRNEVGAIDIKYTTEDLLKEFLIENKIKVRSNVTMPEMQTALREGRIEEYENIISYHYIPEIWHAIVIKGRNSLTSIDDIILDASPIQQIKGDSNIYHVKIPVGGLISKSPITKAFPYQQLHNICLNQVTELLADEPGTFYSIDINSLAQEYKDQDTTESLYSLMDTIKRNKLLPMDLSRTNLQGSTVYPNVFQRNEMEFSKQVLYRRDMAEYFRQQGFQQLGITPQMLGAPTTHKTAEGVQVEATASYALMSNIINDFNTSKAKSNELHIAIAQQCEVNGKSSARLMQNSDGTNAFIDILAEDPEYFPFRKLSVLPASSSKDRAIVKSVQQMLFADNTIQKDLEGIIDIFTHPYLIEMKQTAKDMAIRKQKETEYQRQFEDSQTTKQIQAQQQQLSETRAHELNAIDRKGEWAYKQAYLTAIGRDSTSTKTDDFDQITQAYKLNLQEEGQIADISLKNREISRKEMSDEGSREKQKQDFLLKTKALELKDKQLNTQKYTSEINKN